MTTIRAVSGSVLVLAMALGTVGCSDDDGSGGFALGDALAIGVTPDTLNFGAVAVGEVVELEVSLRHVGTSGTLKLTSFALDEAAAASGDFEVVAPEKTALKFGEVTVVRVRYAPDDAEPDGGSLRIGTNIPATGGGTETVSVPLIALEQRVELTPTPSVVDVGAVATGETGTAVVTLRNLGLMDVTVTSVAFDGGGGQFAVADGPAAGAALPVDAGVDIEVAYTPEGFDQDEASLVVSWESALGDAGEVAIPVRGEEVTARLEAAPSPLDFGLRAAEQVATETLTLRNVGSHPLTVTAVETIALGPYGFTVGIDPWPSEGVTLGLGETIEVPVRFKPFEGMPPGLEPLAAVRIHSNDPLGGGFQDVEVFGQRRGKGLEVVPPDILYFGFVGIGGTAVREVTLFNAGQSDIEVKSLAVQGGFEMLGEGWGPTKPAPEPAVLASGESKAVKLSFTLAPGQLDVGETQWGKVSIKSTDLVKPTWEVLLNARAGTATGCVAQIVPEPVDVGFVTSGKTKTREFALVNIGDSSCTFVDVSVADCTASGLCPVPAGGPVASSSEVFSIVAAPEQGATMGPGESLELVVQVAAPEVGEGELRELLGRVSAWFGSFDPETGDPQVTVVHGSEWGGGANVKAHVALGALLVEPAEVDFGIVPIGCRSETKLVEASNVGPVPLVLTGFELDGCGPEAQLDVVPALSDQLVDGSFVRLLLPNETVELGVSYAPQDEGSDACSVAVVPEEGVEPGVAALVGSGTYETSRTDVFYDAPSQKVDVLFVVDDSGSMGQEQTNLANSFDAFIKEAAAWNSDYQIGVITTTVEGFGDGGDLRGDPPYVTEQSWEKFLWNVKVGTGGSGNEQGLKAAKIALSTPLTDWLEDQPCESDADCDFLHGCHAGFCSGANHHFLREDASLEVIFVSDEDDFSPGEVEGFLDFFTGVKGANRPDLMHLHAIVGPYGGCSGAGGSASVGTRYLLLAEDTGGLTYSICELDFAKAMQGIGELAFANTQQFFLSEQAAPTTISVTVEGVPCPVLSSGKFNWTYDPLTNSVKLLEGGLCKARPGDEVAIAYDLLCYAAP